MIMLELVLVLVLEIAMFVVLSEPPITRVDTCRFGSCTCEFTYCATARDPPTPAKNLCEASLKPFTMCCYCCFLLSSFAPGSSGTFVSLMSLSWRCCFSLCLF